MPATRRWRFVAVVASTTVVLSGCAGWGGGAVGGGGGDSINVLMVNNPQMVDLQNLTAENFTKDTGIRVNFTVLPENDVRDKISQEFSSQAGQYDVASLSNFEIPIYAKAKWIANLDDFIAADPDFDQGDILKPMVTSLSSDGSVYGEPFYGESSILMYNKDALTKAGVTLSNNPTWQDVAAAAKKVNSTDMSGICMRGKPGWGDLFAPLTTVVQTFGGNWYDESWNATVDTPEWKEAVTFYKTMLDESGEADPVSYSFNECLTSLKEGKSAMWADASVAASLLEADDSPVKGKMGYAHMPVDKTEEAGWLWSWNLAIPSSTKNKDAALEFVKWATSKDYIKLVGDKIGWSNVPPGSRTSTYEIPEYKEAAAAYAPITLEVMTAVNPKQPGVNPQPWVGIQYVSIPEFQDVGNQCAQLVADYIANRSTVDEALSKCQGIAQKAGDAHKG